MARERKIELDFFEARSREPHFLPLLPLVAYFTSSCFDHENNKNRFLPLTSSNWAFFSSQSQNETGPAASFQLKKLQGLLERERQRERQTERER